METVLLLANSLYLPFDYFLDENGKLLFYRDKAEVIHLDKYRKIKEGGKEQAISASDFLLQQIEDGRQ